jgi:hypothetical protein
MTRHEKIGCNVVCDLLPLYVDNILSKDSVAIVDAHLLHCPLCASELESLRKPLPGKFSGLANIGDFFRTTESSRKACYQQPLYRLLYLPMCVSSALLLVLGGVINYRMVKNR